MRRSRLFLIAVLLSASCASQPNAPTPLGSPGPLNAVSDIPAIANQRPAESSDPIVRQVELDEINEISAAGPRTLTMSGVVTDKAYPAWTISGATVTLTPRGLTGRTSSAGRYSLRPPAGSYTLQVAKTGYTTATIKQTIGSTLMTLNVALAPTTPSGATARCKDRTWSKSQNRSGACASHKGVAYWVCPGKLCR